MTTDKPEIAPITFERDGTNFMLWLAVRIPSQWSADGVMSTEGQHFATPADLAAAGYTPTSEAARVLNDLQQSHVLEVSALRGKLTDAENSLHESAESAKVAEGDDIVARLEADPELKQRVLCALPEFETDSEKKLVAVCSDLREELRQSRQI